MTRFPISAQRSKEDTIADGTDLRTNPMRIAARLQTVALMERMTIVKSMDNTRFNDILSFTIGATDSVMAKINNASKFQTIIAIVEKLETRITLANNIFLRFIG